MRRITTPSELYDWMAERLKPEILGNVLPTDLWRDSLLAVSHRAGMPFLGSDSLCWGRIQAFAQWCEDNGRCKPTK